MRGYTGGYGNFSDQYYDKYYEYLFTGGGGGFSGSGGGSTSMTFTWHTWNDHNEVVNGEVFVTSEKINQSVTIQVLFDAGNYQNNGMNPNNGGSPLSTWPSWVNNGANAAAYGATVKGGSAGMLKTSATLRYYPSAWTGNQYIKTYNLTKVGTGVGYGTSFVGAGLGAVNFALSDKSWGDYGALGISLTSAALTCFPYTTPIGIGIGVVDITGGFNGFYNYLDNHQEFYNNTGGVILPINNIPTFIPIRRP